MVRTRLEPVLQFVDKLFPGVPKKIVVVLAAAVFFLTLIGIARLSQGSERFLFGDYANVGYGLCTTFVVGSIGYVLVSSFGLFEVGAVELLLNYGGRIIALTALSLGSGLLVVTANEVAGLFFDLLALAFTVLLLGGLMVTVRELAERSRWFLVLFFVIYCNATVLGTAVLLS